MNTQALIEEFRLEFWPNVPNKIGIGTARKAYLKARKKASKERILNGLESYRVYEKKRSRQNDYRPLHPTTWLNGERWDDDKIISKKDEHKCFCGRPGITAVSGKWYCNDEHRIEKLGW